MPPELVIHGYSAAAMFLNRSDADVRAAISIAGAREHRLACAVPHRLDLSFDDVEVPDPRDVISMQRALSRRRFAEANGLHEAPPTMDDARAIIAFAESIRQLDGKLLVHCGAGMSRAPAAALICLNVWRGVGFEQECMDELRSIRPSAVPHGGLIWYADQLLNREGKMPRSLQADRG